ncbi:MAG: DUF1109 domain-containing protein [Acetobacteraceae bacterium]|nr:DUF1109 domain-containing protein [Acetobacteraceae bacterium]
MQTEDLIGDLAAGLRPVRRMPGPGVQAALWLAGAAAAIGVAVLLHGLRQDLVARLMLPQEGAQWLAALATGIAAAFAAAMLARPDRSPRWALLPLPFALAWAAMLGLGCLEDMVRLGDRALQPRLSMGCIRFILGLGIPLGAGLLLLLRHAGPVRPTPVLLLAGLASAALSSAGLTLFHHLDAALEVLVSHGLAIALVAVLGRALGRPLLMRAPVAAG